MVELRYPADLSSHVRSRFRHRSLDVDKGSRPVDAGQLDSFILPFLASAFTDSFSFARVCLQFVASMTIACSAYVVLYFAKQAVPDQAVAS